MGLLLIIMYIFAIALTQMARETVMGDLYFPHVSYAIYTLWINGTLLDNLSTVVYDIKEESAVCLVIFNVFILLAALTVMNMLIGVLCEVVSAVAAVEREEMLVSLVQSKM